MKVEMWNIDRIKEYERNPRKNDHAVNNVAGAIREFGFKVPLIVRSNGELIDGHLRLKAARKLELKKVPVVLADDLTEAQVKAFRISVNKMADLADWDNELLKLEFEDIKLEGLDLTLTGFDQPSIDSLFGEEFIPDLSDDDGIQDGEECKFTLLVTLQSKADQEDLFSRLQEMGYTKIKAG